MEADFSGWATKSGVKCSDGRTIMPDAFKHQDKASVPLLYQHGHDSPENVLGHAILEARPEGVWCEGFFNNTAAGQHQAEAVRHKDITQMSIFANNLLQKADAVYHGIIREVSLVLAGANPGALIENISIRHADGELSTVEDAVIIHSGEDFVKVKEETPVVSHEDAGSEGEGPTIGDIVNSMSQEQRDVMSYIIGQAVAEGASSDSASAEHSESNKNEKEGITMGNVFEQGGDKGGATGATLSHADVQGIMDDALRGGKLSDAVEAYALQHGITDIETLFPEAKDVNTPPVWITRRREWVAGVLGGASKKPFSRIKSRFADLTFDEARAKGYIKGEMKKEQFFGLSQRETHPKTVYKKQKLDRDDIIDITDFDVVVWIKGEMRFMLDEEIARAILIGDGRAVDDDDKIDEDKIRPIATDDDFYAIQVYANIDDASSSVQELIDAIVTNRALYRGSGNPAMYTTEKYIAKFLLLKDTVGRRIYPSLADLAAELRVSAIIPVEVMEEVSDLVAIIVNMQDYSIGTDKGGEVTTFDDFDIDFNQNKWLIETRLSGALTEYRSAMIVRKTAAGAALIVPTVPTFVASTGVITIPTQTGTKYYNATNMSSQLTAGAQTALAAGASATIVAVPASASYYYANNVDEEWTFTRDEA